MRIVKRLIVFGLLALLLIGLLGSGISDSSPTIADTNIPNNEVTGSVNQTDNPSSATATVTITMQTPPLPDE